MAHKVSKIAEYGIIINDDKFLMLKFSKDADKLQRWIFPGGRIDEDENPKEALSREIKEETNLDAEILFPCDVTIWGEGDNHRYAIFFICKLKEKSEIKLCCEHVAYDWFSFDILKNIDYHEKSFEEILRKAKSLIDKLK